MMSGSINSIETFGLVDGPGIRVVVFLNGCSLRCKYCHNPEMFKMGEPNTTPEEILNKILKYRTYFKNTGGVTFSGGEPLLQPDFLIETMQLLKKEGIHIALDTAGVGISKVKEVLKLVDLVILDIKHINDEGYFDITGSKIDKVNDFIKLLNESKKDVWIRQVIIPGVNDNVDYLIGLKKYLNNIKNVKRIDFLPYHRMGREKYLKLGLEYPYEDKDDMNVDKCKKLYEEFLKYR